jgi:hypothetical protein
MRRNLKQNTSETKFKGIKDDVAETANLRAPSKLLTSSKSKSKRVTKRVTNNTHRLTVKRGGKQKPTKETISTEKKPSKKEKTKKNEPGERKFKNKMSEGDEPQEKGPKKTPKVERKARGEGIWVGDRWINTGFDAIW